MTEERMREIAKKHARDSLGYRWKRGEGQTYTGMVDAVYLQNLVRAEEIIFYALKEAFSTPPVEPKEEKDDVQRCRHGHPNPPLCDMCAMDVE